MQGVLLMSDGIDSPVAGHMMKKLGVDLIIVSFLNSNKPKLRKKVENLAKKIGGELIMIENLETQEQIQDKCNSRYQCILCKRSMYRRAEKIAIEKNAKFLITGENLGQVASQTLENLQVLDKSVDIPVLRPLLGFDKDDIVRRAKKIGTFETSIVDSAKCAFVPSNPVTKSRLHKVEREEWKLQNITQGIQSSD